MTTKLEQAARHVFDAWNHGSPLDTEMAALEEALDHSADSGNKVSDHIADAGKLMLTAEQAQQIEEALLPYAYQYVEMGAAYTVTKSDALVERALTILRAARAQEQAEQDLDTCPGCGGVADNGHDREFPPNPYYCTKCSEQAEQEPVVCNSDRDDAYDEIDRFLRNNLDDVDYAAYSDALETLYAAPQPDMNLNCKSVQKRLATSLGYVKAEQAEQKPVAYCCGFENTHPDGWIDCKIFRDGEFTTPLYAAPVRTKDLTDAITLLEEGLEGISSSWNKRARAVIAAYKEKNK